MVDCIVGVISDTHGLLRPEALDALAGSDLILHAGDIGPIGILDRLRQIAPVVAVRGNVDRSLSCRSLPEREVITCGGVDLYLLHNLAGLDLDPVAADFRAVIYGHSHQPAQQMRVGVLYFNPGSAGPRRFSLPISIGRLSIGSGVVSGELNTLG